MKFFNILHLTDLHYGQTRSSFEKGTDFKDSERSKNFKKHYNDSWENMFIDSILNNWINQGNKIDYIAFTGDLGQSDKVPKKEKIKRMEFGLLFLIQLCKRANLDLNCLIIAPGNHDLDRKNSKDPFKDLKELCTKHKIINYSTDKIISIVITEGIKLLSINSCLGATEKILTFNRKYFSKQLDSLYEGRSFKESLEAFKNSQYSYQKDLDIPAIGDEQNKSLINEVSNSDVTDACILLMHHNPIPTTCIEIRPYANLIDGGRLINSLLSTRKKVFILHGHTHFESRISSYFPDSEYKNYITTIGGAALNGTDHGEASLLRFTFCNQIHLKTDIIEIKRNASLFTIKHKFEIFNKQASIDMDLRWHKIEKDKSITYGELKRKLKHTGDDKELMSKVIFWEPSNFVISRNNSIDFKDWKFTRIK